MKHTKPEPESTSGMLEVRSHGADAPRKFRQASIEGLAPEELAAVVLRVAVEHYAPPDIELTAWIGPKLCTARLNREQILALEDVPNVLSVEVSRPIQAIDAK